MGNIYPGYPSYLIDQHTISLARDTTVQHKNPEERECSKLHSLAVRLQRRPRSCRCGGFWRTSDHQAANERWRSPCPCPALHFGITRVPLACE